GPRGRCPVTEPAIEAAPAHPTHPAEGVAPQDKFPLVLGGEHSLPPGAIRPILPRHPNLVVRQLDAHTDLRDGSLGERYSHAAAMRRVLDLPGTSLVSVGIRSASSEEVEFYAANRDRIQVHWAKDQTRWNMAEILAPLEG